MDMKKLDEMLKAMLFITKDLNETEFKTLLGAFVDFWSALHGLSQEECLEIFEDMAEIQKAVHRAIGSAR